MDADRLDTLALARSDAPPTSTFHAVNAALRAEALRQLHWQHREWTRCLATHAPGTPPLIASAAPAGFTDGLDLLREAGEDVPSWLYRRGALVETRGAIASVRLTVLLADLTQALAWFDPEPSARDQAVSAERPPLRSPAPNPDRTAPGVRITPGAHATGCASDDGGPRGVGHGGGGVTWNPTDEGHVGAANNWTVGDRVTARTNKVNVQAGSRGTIRRFSSVGGHPLVDFHGSGLVLIRAEHLDRDDDAPAEASSPGRPRTSGTTRLSATPRPPAGDTVPAPPPPDWFDRQPPPQR